MKRFPAIASFFALSMLLTACAEPEEHELTPKEFMAKVSHEDGVKTLPSGLAYKVLRTGKKDADQPRKGDTVMVIYEGRLPDGSIFDSSEQHGNGTFMEMPLDALIKGWQEALPLMHVGDQWKLYVPPELGYGEKSAGIIPPNSPLVFKIWLIGVDHAHGPSQNDGP